MIGRDLPRLVTKLRKGSWARENDSIPIPMKTRSSYDRGRERTGVHRGTEKDE